ncbi:MAG: DUF348 domain-containing protein [Anaerolineae bacterium]|nr:DUF348 domain-containing protein [Anaerolineae bacterium]
MDKKSGYFLALGLVLLGLSLVFLGLMRPVTIYLDGYPLTVQTRALTVNGILRSAGIEISNNDALFPPRSHLPEWNAVIRLDHAAQVSIWTPQGLQPSFFSTQRLPANLLFQAGVRLYPADRILWNGQDIRLDQPLPFSPTLALQYIPATALRLQQGTSSTTIHTSASSVGEALWATGVRLSAADSTNVPLNQKPDPSQQVLIRRAQTLSIQTPAGTVLTRAASDSVGEALAIAGMTLQGSDYSIPAEDQPLPESGEIRVIRVSETFVLEQEVLPFENEYIADASLPLDQRKVIETGRQGLKVKKVRTRYEDDVETQQLVEDEWIAVPPVNQKIGYGTQVNIQEIATPDGVFQYWRAITVYATSYSPCRSGTSKCHYGTASGLPVKKGVVGVTPAWFRLMAGQQVYIPGYGLAVIADTGGGIPGKQWIDLGFSDEDFVSWHSNVTMYFLTPVPAAIPYILP